MPLLERILSTVRRHDLIPAGTRVLAAVSGGADSVALACALSRLFAAGTLDGTLAGLVHLHHGLRGVDADEDARFVEALAARLGVPCVVEHEDVAARAREAGESIEAAGHRARYAFFARAAAALGADRVATGHTVDDQAETFVLRLMRGAGLQGLSAIRPRAGQVVRPLLDVTRADVEAFLRETEHPWREDITNRDRAILRNRVRHELMPVLRELGGSSVSSVLARTAALVRDDADELERQAIEMARGDVLMDDTGLRLSVEGLSAAGPALARRIVRAALARTAEGHFHGLEHVEAVRSLIETGAPSAVQVPGVTAHRTGGGILLVPATPSREIGPFAAALDVPGAVECPAAGLIVSAEFGRCDGDVSRFDARGDGVAVQGLAAGPLTVRNRRPGDAFRPLGAPGRRKVQDLFVDRKVARGDRDRVPLIVDARGRIVWVVGHAMADEFRVSAPDERVLLLKVRRTGAA